MSANGKTNGKLSFASEEELRQRLEAGHLLEVLGLEVDARGGADAVRFLPPRDERLTKPAAHGFSPVQAQVAFARAQASGKPALIELRLDAEAITPVATLSGLRAKALEKQSGN